MQERGMADRRLDQAQDSMYGFEHMAAQVMALAAVVLGVLGVLVGFDIINLRDVVGIDTGLGAAASTISDGDFWDATMLLFSAITLGVLSYSLHTNDHHRLRDLSTLRASERGMWTMEHSAAYLFTVLTIALIVIGLLTGFGVFSNDQDQRDGLIWVGSASAPACLPPTSTPCATTRWPKRTTSPRSWRNVAWGACLRADRANQAAKTSHSAPASCYGLYINWATLRMPSRSRSRRPSSFPLTAGMATRISLASWSMPARKVSASICRTGR